jgi:hypothetical protein
MSGFGTSGIGDGGQATSAVGSAMTSGLMQILQATEILPGSQPSYELCKAIYVSHVLGSKMVDTPIALSQSQPREITVPLGPEERLKEAFLSVWDTIGGVGADAIIANTQGSARIYGISALAMGARGQDASKPLDREKLYSYDLFFNVLDPLTTAGSLVLSQDPNSPDFQRPQHVRVGATVYHPANTVVVMNEKPIYIQYSDSAFGFTGRSVYQRALYPLKSFVQTMITDDMVAFKAGVLVLKLVAQSSNTNRRLWDMFNFKRQQLKTASTGNVISLAPEEAAESMNLQMLAEPYRLARENILKNIAAASNMPEYILNQENMVSVFAEGKEDGKQIARYIDGVRTEMRPLYVFFDDIVQRVAWNPDFYKGICRDFPEYRKLGYERTFCQWRNSFDATWPSLLIEPESEQILVEDVRFKAVIGLIETMSPLLDPENRARLVGWVADEINSRKKLFTSELMIDEEELRKASPQVVESWGEGREPEVAPEAYEDSAAENKAIAETLAELKKLLAATKRAKSDDDPAYRLKEIIERRREKRNAPTAA